jgi:hypothetical protein
LHEQSLLVADEETIAGANPTSLSPLVSMLGLPAEAQIDILNEENSDSYWQRSDMFDLALDLTGGRRGLDALAQAMTRWIAHLLALDVTIEPLTELRDASFTWYVGLDAEATQIGDQIWNGETLDDRTTGRVVGLFRVVFPDSAPIADAIKGEPAYLIMAMTADKIVRMKPQNLVTGFPVRQLEVAS